MKKTVLVFLVIFIVLLSCKTKTPSVPESLFVPGETDMEFVEFEHVDIGPEDLPIIQALSSGLSPNGDGFADSIDFYIHTGKKDKIKNWKISIKNEKKVNVETVAGDKKIPELLTWGGLDKEGSIASEGDYTAEISVTYTNLKTYSSESAPFSLVLHGPEGEIKLSDGYFSPDGDGINDTLKVTVKVDKPDTVASWEMDILDPTGLPFYILKDAGEAPDTLIWNGKKNNSEETVQSAMDYSVKVILTDLWGNSAEYSKILPVDILVFKDGDRYRINIASITFLPYSADYSNVPEEEYRKNIDTLDRLSEKLKKFRDYNISIEGHAVHVFWFDEKKKKIEQEEVLLQLSQLRADVIKEALVQRGIEGKRMNTIGVGGNKPVVPFSDLQNRWKNRRVEFLLEK